MKVVPNQTVSQLLLQSESYRHFVRDYFAEWKRIEPRFSYGFFALRAGFASKSFARDVMLGKKRLSPRSLPSFTRALGLAGEDARLFEAMVETEDFAYKLENKDPGRIEVLRSRVRPKLGYQPSPSEKAEFYRITEQAFVFAAMGADQQGATIEQICQKTGYSSELVIEVLKEMLTRKTAIATPSGDRFYAATSRLVMTFNEQNYFVDYFKACAKHLADTVEQNMSSNEKLFISAAFTVNRNKLPELKAKLRELLTQFLDDSEEAGGDNVVNLTCGMAPLKE